MTGLFKRVGACLLVLGFLAGGVGARASAAPARKACCGKSCPSAPKVPCAQMACCREGLPNAAVAVPPVAVVAFAAPSFAATAAPGAAERVPAAPDCGPPGRAQEQHAGRSPPPALPG